MKRTWIYLAIIVIAVAFIQNVWAQKSIQESSTEVVTTVKMPNWPDSLSQVGINTILPLPNNSFCVGGACLFHQELTGLWVSVNNGPWIQKGPKDGLTASSGYITSLIASNGKIFAGAWNGLFLSTDNGISWNKIQNFSVSDLLVTPNAMFAADTGIFRSTDNGTNWTQVAGGNFTYPYIWKLGYSSSSAMIFAGIGSGVPTGGRGILRSSDNGNSWSFANSGLSSHKNVYGIACQANSQTVFIVTEDDGVYQSLNNGNSWSKFSIPEVYGTAAAAFPNLGTFFGLSTIGKNRSALYRSKGLGALDTIPGYAGAAIGSMVLVNSNTIAVGTDRGLYITTFSILSTPVDEVLNTTPKEFSLSQNYPNPFNPSTKISFNIPRSSMVTLDVYDILGKEIAVLVNQEMTAGNHEVSFDASRFSSGTYLYRLQSGNFTETKKMVLMK